jgi:hypothetical protein
MGLDAKGVALLKKLWAGAERRIRLIKAIARSRRWLDEIVNGAAPIRNN